MGSYQIWPCHVTQAKNLSFPYLKSYCPLNFWKSHQISWFCCIPNGSYKDDNMMEGRICPPMWNSVNFLHCSECRRLENNFDCNFSSQINIYFLPWAQILISNPYKMLFVFPISEFIPQEFIS